MNNKKCWICGDAATTAEHLVKKSDLQRVFGAPPVGRPLFLHNIKSTNQRVQGLNSKKLKFTRNLCAKCNNERTQPFDRAWEAFSRWVSQKNFPYKPGNKIRPNRVFRHKPNQNMLNVHLYFTKLFGCIIDAESIPIDLEPFSKAILEGQGHPGLFLTFGWVPRTEQIVGISGAQAVTDNKKKEVVAAHWFYELNEIAVYVFFATQPKDWENTEGAWHPKDKKGGIRIADFSPMFRNNAD